MKKISILISIFCLTTTVFSQQADSLKTNNYTIKTQFNGKNLDHFLTNVIDYPNYSILKREEGCVILAFTITKEGIIDSIIPVKFPSKQLLIAAIVGLEQTNNQWKPTIKNGEPVDWNYKIAINFNMYMEQLPIDYAYKANRQFKKEKYLKAIDFYTKAIEKNPYESSLYFKRSNAKSKFGDIEGAQEDKLKMYNLSKEFIGSYTISIVGIARTSNQYKMRQ